VAPAEGGDAEMDVTTRRVGCRGGHHTPHCGIEGDATGKIYVCVSVFVFCACRYGEPERGGGMKRRRGGVNKRVRKKEEGKTS